MGKALNWRGLAGRSRGREFVIRGLIIVVVAVEDGNDEVPLAAAGFGQRFAMREALALEHEGTILTDETGICWGNDAVRNGGGKFGQEAADICVVDWVAGDGFEFTGEIGGANAAARSVKMVEAEAVGIRSGGESAAASVGEGEAAAGGVEGDGTLASHGVSIA